MDAYFTGSILYGDDFSIDEIEKWYEIEAEGYADLGSKDYTKYSYSYHAVNQVHGFSKLSNQKFEKVLGFGSAWGDEFEPLVNMIFNLTIIEPSDNLRSTNIGGLIPNYVKPSISGKLEFDDNSFDLITSFGVLHHIPNVSFVLGELIRVLKPGGYLLLREPIISMGDWRNSRPGLTKNERGIPVSHFDIIFENKSVHVVSKQYCFSGTSFLQKILKKILNRPLHSYKLYVLLDKYLSKMLKSNVKYHTESRLQRICPQSIFYVVKK